MKVILLNTLVFLTLLSGCSTLDKAAEQTLVYDEQTEQYVPNPELQDQVNTLGNTLGAFGVPYAGAATGGYALLVTGLGIYANRKKKKPTVAKT